MTGAGPASHTAGANDLEIALTLGGVQTFATAAAGSLSVSTNVDLNGNNLTFNANTGTITLGGVVSGTGNLTKNGTGILLLSGASANTYVGTMTVNTGTLELNKSSGSAITGDLTVFSSAISLIAWDVFDAVLTPGDVILLLSWRDETAAEAFERSVGLQDGARLRRVRVVRDYGMFDRREAPQYYPEVSRSHTGDR